MENIKIGSFNTMRKRENSWITYLRAIRTAAIAEQLQLDLLGLQETTWDYIKQMECVMSQLQIKAMEGTESQFGEVSKNANVTKYPIFEQQDYCCPWCPPTFIRYQLEMKKKSLNPNCISITRLDSQIPNLFMANVYVNDNDRMNQIRQLRFIKSIVSECPRQYPIILAGDFHMQTSDKIFSDFILDLYERGLQRVDISEPTMYDKNGIGKETDHIFLPNHNLQDYQHPIHIRCPGDIRHF